MAIADIIKKIEDEATKKADFMKQVADDEIKKIQDEAEKKAEASVKEVEEAAEKRCLSMVEKAKVLAKMENSSTLLKAKRQLVDEAYEGAQKSLDELGAGAYIALLAKMLKKAAQELPTGELIVPKNRVKESEEALKQANVDYKITQEVGHFRGGFIVKNGAVEMNLSFSTLLNQVVRPATEISVAQILF